MVINYFRYLKLSFSTCCVRGGRFHYHPRLTISQSKVYNSQGPALTYFTLYQVRCSLFLASHAFNELACTYVRSRLVAAVD